MMLLLGLHAGFVRNFLPKPPLGLGNLDLKFAH